MTFYGLPFSVGEAMPDFSFGLLWLFCAASIQGKLVQHDQNLHTGPPVSNIPFDKTNTAKLPQHRNDYEHFYDHSDGISYELGKKPTHRVGHLQGHLDTYTTSEKHHNMPYGPPNGQPGQRLGALIHQQKSAEHHFPHNTQTNAGYYPDQYRVPEVPRGHSLKGGANNYIASYNEQGRGGYNIDQYGPINDPTGPVLSRGPTDHIESYNPYPTGGYDLEQYGPINGQAVHASLPGSHDIRGQKGSRTVKVRVVPHGHPNRYLEQVSQQYAKHYYDTESGPKRISDSKYADTSFYSRYHGVEFGPEKSGTDTRSYQYDRYCCTDYGSNTAKADTKNAPDGSPSSLHLTNRQGRTSVNVNINLKPDRGHYRPDDHADDLKRPKYATVIERNNVPIITFKKIPRVVMKTVQSTVPVVRFVRQLVDLSTRHVIKTGSATGGHSKF